MKSEFDWQAKTILGLLITAFCAVIYIEAGCKNPSTPIDVTNAATCVIEKALGGETIAQIAVECAAPVETVIVDLLTAPPQAGIVGTNAELEARHARIVIMGTNFDAGAMTGNGK